MLWQSALRTEAAELCPDPGCWIVGEKGEAGIPGEEEPGQRRLQGHGVGSGFGALGTVADLATRKYCSSFSNRYSCVYANELNIGPAYTTTFLAELL